MTGTTPLFTHPAFVVAALAAAAPVFLQAEAPGPASASSRSPAPVFAGEDQLNNPRAILVREVSREDIELGTPIYAQDGQQLGIVTKVTAARVTISDGKGDYEIPIEQVYAYRVDGADYFASRLPKAQLALAR